jgi:N-acylneuraminate cytidylyltransferase/CMP-N,N'-diacetyllegionaminic acid synthase
MKAKPTKIEKTEKKKDVPSVTVEDDHDIYRGEIENPRVLCVIPARAGSKGVPNKNIKPLWGKPLLWHTIQAVRDCGYPIGRIVVSTESQQYADVVEGWCGKGLVPFLRPGELAHDTTPTFPVIISVIDTLKERYGEMYDVVLVLEPTSPLRTAQQINEALTALFKSKYHSLVSVFKSDQCHPIIAFKVGRDNQLQPYDGSEYPAHPRRQALSPVYFMDGSLYASFIDTYRQKQCFDHEDTLAYVMEPWQFFEIDNEWDFYAVEGIMRWRALPG